MLYAIAIYTHEQNQKPAFKKISSAQQDKGLFPSNQLEDLEKLTLPAISPKISNEEKQHQSAESFQVNGEHHYIMRLSNTDTFMAIVSKKKLSSIELTHLFKNIEHIHQRPEKVKITLADIIANPIGYIGKDVFLNSIIDQSNQVKVSINKAVGQQISNLIHVDELDKKSDGLLKETEKFNRGAGKLNSCCRL